MQLLSDRVGAAAEEHRAEREAALVADRTAIARDAVAMALDLREIAGAKVARTAPAGADRPGAVTEPTPINAGEG
ncbi:MAG: hypothetical protein IPK81_14100 [Rhodospirillales bacterium]|nr:MAG: hypothetical protein IPK81_14100 [Rhodospirillales bacterium]